MRLLLPAGPLQHGVAHLTEKLDDVHAGFLDMGEKSLRIGAIAALAIERMGAVFGGVGDQRISIWLDGVQPPTYRTRAAGAQHAYTEGVVAARIKDDKAQLPSPICRRQHLIERHCRKIDIASALQLGIGGDEEVPAVHLDAMTGEVDSRDVGPLSRGSERLKSATKPDIVEVEPWLRAREAEASQCSADGPGIVHGCIEWVRMFVDRIADNQRDALFPCSGHSNAPPKRCCNALP